MQDSQCFTPWPDDVAKKYHALGYWQGEALGSLLDKHVEQNPERVALVCGSRRWSYVDLHEQANQLAAGFQRMGLQAQDRVVVQLPNIGEFFIVLFALFRLGVIPVLALPAHRRSEIQHFCQHSEARAYVIAAEDEGFDYRQLAREVKTQASSELQVFVVGEAQEFTALDTLYDTPSSLPAIPASHLAFLQLSGGSTGQPKLIPRTHDDYFYSVRASADICGLSAETVYLCALPVAHNFPLSSPGSLGTFYAGGTVVLARRPTPEEAFPLIQAEGVTLTALVPSLAMIWLEGAKTRLNDLRSLQCLQVGGASFAPEIARRITTELECRLQQVFGMAEGLVNYTRIDDTDELITTTQGRAISPDDEIRIVNDDDVDVIPGTTGHLLTRGPYTIRGYYRADEHNLRAFTADGYYRTGDLVRQLPSGHLVVEGRAKDQINRGGEKIAAEEVENHLLAHPEVRDAAIVAMPDLYLGEKTCAFVQLHNPALRPAQLMAFLRQRGMATYKLPDRILVVDSFPITAVGKINKRALREKIAQQLALASAPQPS